MATALLCSIARCAAQMWKEYGLALGSSVQGTTRILCTCVIDADSRLEIASAFNVQ